MAAIPFFRMPSLPGAAFAGDPEAQAASGGMYGGGGWQDKLFALGAMLSGHPEMAMQIPMMRLGQQAFARDQAATADLARYASGKPVPTRAEIAAKMGAPPLNPDADGFTAGAEEPQVALPSSFGDGSLAAPKIALNRPVTYVPPRDPSADLSGPPTVRGAMPFLAKKALAGGNITPWVEMLKAAQPNLQFVNGIGVDTNDASNVNKKIGVNLTNVNGFQVDNQDPRNANRFLPKIADGALPLYDKDGNVVAQKLLDGTVQALESTARATAAGEASGKLPYVAPTAQAQAAGTKLGEIPFTITQQNVNGVPTTMTVQQAIGLATGHAPGEAAAGSAGAAPVGDQRLDPKAFFHGFVLGHEGGYNPSDLNGAPVKYGVNQAANPGVDVKNLKPEDAANIFAERFQRSGAANLPPALAAVHADTFWINEKKAQQFLAASGGDPNKYLDLRDAWLSHLAQTKPGAADYAKAWTKRDADLRALVQQLTGGQAAAPAATATAPPAAPGLHGVNAEDEKKVASYIDDAKQAEEVAADARRYQKLNRETYTGPIFNPVRIHIPLLGEVPINPISGLGSAFQPGAQNMDNLSMRMATGLRAPGQRLTQAEIFQNLKTVPNRTSMAASNDASVDQYVDRAATKRAYATFMQNYLSQHGSLVGADAAWASQQKGGGQSGAAPPAKPMKGQPMQQIKTRSGATVTVIPVG